MVAGFVHGVLNTDNMNITGESFDHGPWRWLPHFDPNFTAAYFGLVDAAYAYVHASRVGYDRFFFDWYGGEASRARALAGPEAGRYAGDAFAVLCQAWAGYEPAAPERLADPYYGGEGPCAVLIDEVEALWSAIAGPDDWAPWTAKIAEIRRFGALHGHAPATL